MSRWALFFVILTDVWCPSTTGILHAYNYLAMNGNTSFWAAFYRGQLNRIARELNVNLRGTDEYTHRRGTTCCRGRPPPPSEYARKDGPEKLRCPTQFCEFRSEILTSYLNRMCTQTESLRFFFFFFLTKMMATFVFFGSLYRSYLSNEKRKEKKKQPFYLLVDA